MVNLLDLGGAIASRAQTNGHLDVKCDILNRVPDQPDVGPANWPDRSSAPKLLICLLSMKIGSVRTLLGILRMFPRCARWKPSRWKRLVKYS